MKKLLRKFGYVKLSDIDLILSSRSVELRNQIPYPQVTTAQHDKMCKRDKAFWFQQRYEWNAIARELEMLKITINKVL